jgi:hypothetical protein
MKHSTTGPSRFALVMTLSLAACVHQAEIYTAPAPTTVKAAYECAAREMAALDYFVGLDSATGGQLGDRAGSLHGFTYQGHVNHDRLLVTVLGTDSTGTRGLRITASTIMWVTFANKTNKQKAKTSDSVRADAKTVLIKCTRDVMKGAK